MKYELQVLGKSYMVHFVGSEFTGGNMGNTNVGKAVITVSTGNCQSQQEDSLLHEVLHVIDVELGLDLSEGTIRRLAVGLHSAGYTKCNLMVKEE